MAWKRSFFHHFASDYGIERSFDPVVRWPKSNGLAPGGSRRILTKIDSSPSNTGRGWLRIKGLGLSRAERLLALIQILHRHRYPVSGAVLASELNVSLRTLYRDIASLQAQGARIDGEPGVGYVLRPGFMLPP